MDKSWRVEEFGLFALGRLCKWKMDVKAKTANEALRIAGYIPNNKSDARILLSDHEEPIKQHAVSAREIPFYKWIGG